MRRNTFVYIIARLLQLVAMVVTLKVLTTQLEPTELGKYNIIMIVYGLFALFLVNPIGMFIRRQQHEWDDSGLIRNRILKSILYFSSVTLFAAIIIHYFLGSFSNHFGITNIWLLICICASLFFHTMNETLISYINLRGRFTTWAVLTHTTLWGGLIAAYWFTNINHNSINWFMGILCGYVIGLLAAVIPFLKYTRPKKLTKSKTHQPISIRSTLAFVLPVSIAVGLGWVQYQSYRIAIGYMESLHYLGLFVAGYAISSGIFQAFETTIQQYTNPTFYKGISGKNLEGISKVWIDYYQTIVPMVAIAMIFIIIMAKPLLHFLVNEKYWAASQFVMLGALVEAVRVTGNVYVMAAHAVKKTDALVIPQMLGALTVVIFSPISIYYKSPQLLAASLVAAGLIYVTTLHFKVSSLFKKKFQVKHISKVLLAPVVFYLIHASIKFIGMNPLVNFIVLGVSGIVYIALNYNIVKSTIWLRPSL